eukprot:9441513-Karenia_brevis.AAC.1
MEQGGLNFMLIKFAKQIKFDGEVEMWDLSHMMEQCKPAIDGLEGYPYMIHCEQTDTAMVSLADSR